MFNFDSDRFLRIESGAYDAAAKLGKLVQELVDNGADSLFFMGSGGAGILMQPAAEFMARESVMPCYNVLCAEIVLTGHQSLDQNSIVIIPSLSGTTKESIEALQYVKGRGATTITLVGHANTPLAQQADHCLINFAQDDTSCEMFYLLSLTAVLGAMQARGEVSDYAVLIDELKSLPEQLLKIKQDFEPRAKLLAATIQNDGYHIITGAGPVWPEAYYYGMCILEEMQWIRTRPVHASDFFHGTLELVEKGVSVIVFMGEDETRPICERVVNFAKKHTDRLIVLDTKEVQTVGLSPLLRAMLAPAILATMLERLSSHLEHFRNHPLETRRYYRRVEY